MKYLRRWNHSLGQTKSSLKKLLNSWLKKETSRFYRNSFPMRWNKVGLIIWKKTIWTTLKYSWASIKMANRSWRLLCTATLKVKIKWRHLNFSLIYSRAAHPVLPIKEFTWRLPFTRSFQSFPNQSKKENLWWSFKICRWFNLLTSKKEPMKRRRWSQSGKWSTMPVYWISLRSHTFLNLFPLLPHTNMKKKSL